MPNLKDVHACFEEALRIAGFASHGPVIIRPATVNLMVVLSDAITSGSADYKVPSGSVLLVKESRGHIAFRDWDAEGVVGVDVLAASGYVSPRDRIDLKATNTRLRLENIDRSSKITEEADISLYDILRQPIRWDEMGPGFVVPAGQTLKLTCSLIDTDAALAGAATEVGMLLSGVLLEVIGA